VHGTSARRCSLALCGAAKAAQLQQLVGLSKLKKKKQLVGPCSVQVGGQAATMHALP